MNADEIVKALRENAEWCDANEYDVPLCMGDNQRAAADLIESLQAKHKQAALNYQQKCRDVVELEAQLAEVKKDAQVGFYRSLFYIDITLSEFYLTFEDFGILKTSNSKKCRLSKSKFHHQTS